MFLLAEGILRVKTRLLLYFIIILISNQLRFVPDNFGSDRIGFGSEKLGQISTKSQFSDFKCSIRSDAHPYTGHSTNKITNDDLCIEYHHKRRRTRNLGE